MSNDLAKKLENLHSLQGRLNNAYERLMIKGLMSDNPDFLLKANILASKTSGVIQQKQDDARMSFLLDPYEFNRSTGYKDKPFSMSYQTLKRMSKTEVVASIIRTRLSQIRNFSEPQESRYSTGFIIRKKRPFYSSDSVKTTKKDEVTIQKLTEVVLNCGFGNEYGDDFDTFTAKFMRDSLTYDQGTFEIENDNKGIPFNVYATDASTHRLADSIIDEEQERLRTNNSDVIFNPNFVNKKQIKGHYPKYVQIYNGVVLNEYYPWQLCFGVRNPVSDIHSYGYGYSELEELITTVTSLIYGSEYNRRQFSQGSMPKGFFKVQNGTSRANLQRFKQDWVNMLGGVFQSHKIPFIEGDKVEWIDMTKNNRDMEYTAWIEFLIKITCAIYTMDPAEINFPLSGGAEQRAMFEGNNEARLKHSKDRGLYPLLRFHQKNINKYWLSKIAPDFEFVYVGLDSLTPQEELDMMVKKLTNFMKLDEVREYYGLSPDAEVGDNVLNGVYSSLKQQASMMQQQGGEEGDEVGEMFNNNENDDQYQYEEGSDQNEVKKAFDKYLKSI